MEQQSTVVRPPAPKKKQQQIDATVPANRFPPTVGKWKTANYTGFDWLLNYAMVKRNSFQKSRRGLTADTGWENQQ